MTYNNPKTACGTYQKNDVTNLTPVQIIARLYEALERDLVLAKKAMMISDRGIMGEKISHALAILGELQIGLDFDKGGEISINLNSLYDFVFSQITKANISNNPEGLDSAIETITPLAEAWLELAEPKKDRVVQRMGAKPMVAAGAVAFHATF